MRTTLIRDAAPADLPQIVALARSAATAAQWDALHYEGIFEGQRRTAQLQSAHRIAMVLEDAGDVRGFVVARAAADEWELENVVVAEAVRRRGLGTELITALLERAGKSRVQVVFLEVRASNAAARALYEKCGFRQTGKRPRYYHDPEEDAILYSYTANPGDAAVVKRD